MPPPPTGHSASTSSYGSSNSSLFAPPIDILSSQSDISDSNPLFMPRGDASIYALAASPSQADARANNSTISASQKFRRAFGRRRNTSQDATSLFSSSDDNHPPPDPSLVSAVSSHMTPHSASNNPPSNRPKLTMHLFGGRNPNQSPQNHPPTPPPKPVLTPLPPLQIPTTVAGKLSINLNGARPRSSIIATSPSINPAIQFMREDEERQQRQQEMYMQQLEQNKEDWRKSDSTVASGHTVRPLYPVDGSSAGKRRSTYSGSPNSAGDLGLDLRSGTEASTSDVLVHPPAGKHAKRRSLSLNINVTPAPTYPNANPPAFTPPSSSMLPLPSPTTDSHPYRSISPNPDSLQGTRSLPLTPASRDTSTLTHTVANGIIGSGTASGFPASKTNIRGRFAAWAPTATSGRRSNSPLGASSVSSSSLSTPSATSLNQSAHHRIPVTSTASQELQVIAAVREIQNRSRSPSASSTSTAGIRHAATSLTSGASAMALGFGKRAYEKVGRVWAGSGTGSGSDTPGHNSSGTAMANPGEDAVHLPRHAPSAFPARHKQDAVSGTWSVSSLSGGSRSSSERERGFGRDTPPSGPGRLVRPPRSIGSGVVFGRELWECVRETRATVPANHPLAGRMIPALVLRCAQHLHRWGIQEEGLFRISGRSSHVNRLRHDFDSGADYDIIECSPSELDPHAVASVFKAYLRELPEPILTRALLPLFDSAMNAESSRAAPTTPTSFMPKPIGGAGPGVPAGPRATSPLIRKPPSLSTFTLPTSTSLRSPSTSLVEALGDLVARLPRENRDLLRTVVELMQATASQSKETKMPLSNLLLVFCPSLSMGPTLLRVLCDTSGVWERALEPPVVSANRSPAEQDEGEESDDSDSDSVSSYGNAKVVTLPSVYKDAGGDMPEDNARLEVAMRAAASSEKVEPRPTEIPAPPPLARPRTERRVVAPSPRLEDQHSSQTSPISSRSCTPPPSESHEHPTSASSPSLNDPSRSMTPLSAASLTSIPAIGSSSMDSPLRSRQFSSPPPSSGISSLYVLGSPDHNKDLPASPTSPQSSIRTDSEDRASNTTPLRVITDTHTERTPPRALLSSHSAPSVVFPSAKTPSTPTSLKKQVFSLSASRLAKLSSDTEGSSPPKRVVRRPSLNILFNMKRGSPSSPRSRTPTISSPLSTPASVPSSVDSSPRTVTNPFPPILSLPSLDTNTDVGLGLGWDDVFGSDRANEAVSSLPPQPMEPPQPRPTAISQPSSQSPRLQAPPSAFRRPTTEFLLSSGGFFGANGPPHALPSPASVLEAADVGVQTGSLGDGEAEPTALHEDSSSGPDSPEVDSPVKELFTPPPHLSFQLDQSSMEEEDWANAVLMAAHKPAESLA